MNEGRLIFPEMKVDNTPFPIHTNMHTIDLSNAKVLLRTEQAEGAKGKNVVLGEVRPKNADNKVPDREVVLEKAPDGKELIKITVKAHVPRGKKVLLLLRVGLLSRTDRSDRFHRPVRPVRPRVDQELSSPSARKIQGKMVAQKPTFGQLLNKYTKAVRQDRPLKKRAWSPRVEVVLQ